MTQAARDTQMQDIIVFARDGAIYANSRDVAEAFEKRHDHVLRDIDALLGSPDLGNLTNQGIGAFRLVTAFDERANKEVRSFDMTKDGFTLLAMGYTGQKAMAFKVRYINAFNAMADTLREALPARRLEAMDNRLKALEASIRPLIEGHDETQAVVNEYVPVLWMLKQNSAAQAGRRALVCKCTAELKRYFIALGKGNEIRFAKGTKIHLFKFDTASEWFKVRGNALIREHNDKAIGQNVLPFAKPRRRAHG